MKYLNTYESFLNESTTDGTIEALIEVTKLSMKAGVFNDELLADVKDDFVNGIEGTLKGQTNKLNPQQRKEFNGYVEALMGPLRKANTMAQFLGAMRNVAITKDNIMNRMLSESINASSILNMLKNAKSATIEWWQRNKYDIVGKIVEMLVRIVLEILFGILRALLKTDDLKTPKFKFDGFGGGKFGGGGAGSKW